MSYVFVRKHLRRKDTSAALSAMNAWRRVKPAGCCAEDKSANFSWLDRNGKAPDWKRGLLLKTPVEYEQKNQELRVRSLRNEETP